LDNLTNDKTKTIRVCENTLKMLGNLRKGFETPDQCLERILSGLQDDKANGINADAGTEEPKITLTRID